MATSFAPPAAAYLPAETWLFNGVPLQSAGQWSISTFGGSRFGMPTLRGQNVEVPYRAGQAWRAKYPDQRTVTLTMWLTGDASSSQPYPASDSRLAFNDNWQALRAAFWLRGADGSVQGKLTRNWYLSAGGPGLVTATAMAEVAGSLDLTMNGRTGAAFTVDLLLADPYFYGSQISQQVGASGTITNPGDGICGEGFASPVNSFTIACSAPTTVSNTTAGTSLTVASGPAFPVTVDVLGYTATDANGANVIGSLTHTGSRLLGCLLPGENNITVSSGTATWIFNPAYL